MRSARRAAVITALGGTDPGNYDIARNACIYDAVAAIEQRLRSYIQFLNQQRTQQ